MSLQLHDVNQLIGHSFEPFTVSYTERDVALYALAVGAPTDWLDQTELQYVYELSSAGFRVLPTYPVLFLSPMIDILLSGRLGNISFNPMMLVHGEQTLRLQKALPTAADITCYPHISAIYDKGSGMLVVVDVSCHDSHGDEITLCQSAMFIRGLGGFGGERGPSGDTDLPPERPPDAIMSEKTLPQQALLYRLCGDRNPLHADPAMAAFGGFDRPILHGLCTFGFAGRAVLKHFCGKDPSRFKSIKVRFAKPVFPGDTLVTAMWQEGSRVIFRTTTAERGEVVLANAAVELNV
jgi:3-hydroxyacyl-CoA dehydrogenase/3a,7a,12a-trihydroxy-5b-cholest-24-enoyl-CoA hydratase